MADKFSHSSDHNSPHSFTLHLDFLPMESWGLYEGRTPAPTLDFWRRRFGLLSKSHFVLDHCCTQVSTQVTGSPSCPVTDPTFLNIQKVTRHHHRHLVSLGVDDHQQPPGACLDDLDFGRLLE